MDNGNGGLSASDIALMSGGGGIGGFGNGGWESIIFIIAILALLGGGFGNGFGGGFGGYGMQNTVDFPWLMSGQQGINTNTNSGFRDQMINDNITSVRDSVANLATQLCGCCGDIQMALANGFAGVNTNLCNGFNNISQQLYQNEIASLNRSFDAQAATSQGFNNIGLQLCQASADNRLGVANLGSDIAREACATRTADTQNTQLILNAINDGFRYMSDQRYQDKIDAKNDEIAQLRQENLYARGQASQIAQNQQIVDAIYNRLDTCPVGTTPVYGRTPIFNCNNGCGCNNVV